MNRGEAAKIGGWIAGSCARLGSPFQRRWAGWALRQPTDGPTQTETTYDDLRRACRRRDPGWIDPLRHVFEDAMSGPLRRCTRFFGAWQFFEMAIRM
jgi:hypothetical protein